MWKKLKWKNTIVILIVVIFSVTAFFVVKNYIEKKNVKSYYESMSTNSAIEFGRAYVNSLLENYPYLINGSKKCLSEKSLSHLSIGDAKSKVEGIKFMPTSPSELVSVYRSGEAKGISGTKLSPLLPKKENIELVSLSRDENKMALQFIYQHDLGGPVLIYDSQKMIFTINLEYKNADLGMKGSWFVSGLDYKYNINDYVNWISSL